MERASSLVSSCKTKNYDVDSDSFPDPEDSILLAAFTRYSRENSGSGLNEQDQLARLKLDFGLDIK